VVRLSGPAGGYPARGGAAWAWFLLLLLLAALGAYAARNRLAHDWATLVIDLPWAGFVLALLGLALGRWRARRPAAAKASRPARRGLIAAAGLAAVALLFLLAPSLLLAGRTGLTVRAARAWGVMEGGPAIESPVEPRALGGIPAGTAPFLVASGWVYAPGSGTYAPTIASAGPATLWIDGRPIVVVPPAPEAEPVVGVDRGRYRESTVYLDRGFHRLTVWYSAGAGPRPRWRLPYADALHRLPVDHLLSDETSPAERGMRARLLAARRWGVLGLASLAVASVAAVLARVAPTVAGGRAGGLSTAGHAAVALICFTLTGTSLLLWDGQLDALRPVLLTGLPVAMLASVLVRARRAGRRATRLAADRSWGGARTGLALLVLLAIQVALVVRFLVFVDGRLPLPGDHSSFLYRYHVLLHVLPRLRGYDPWWNAGTVDSSAALSGAASTLVLFWPLLWIAPLERVYAAFVPLVGAGLVPWCLFAATRLLGGSPLAALLAGVLALAPDETYFWWFMAHGTLPAAVSAALATLGIALAWRVFVCRDRRWWLVLGLVASLTIGLFWALFAVMVAPTLLLGALIFRRRFGRGELRLALVILGTLVLVHGHWLAGLRGTLRVPYTASGPIGAVPWARFLSMGLDVVLIDPSPIALVLGVIAVLLLPRPLRLAWGVFVGSLLLTGTVLRPLFPWLELERFFVPLSFALIPPAAGLAARALRAGARGAPPAAAALGLGVLALLGVHAAGVWRQFAGETRRGASQMEFESDETRRLIQWLRAAPSGDARIVLGGDLPGVGRLGGGYPAFLQPLSGRPLLGYHQNFKAVDLHIWDLLATGDLRETLDLLNVRYVVLRSNRLKARARLDDTPGVTLRERLPGEFLVYEAPPPSGYLVGARGHVAFDYDRLVVRLDEPAPGPVTLKFRWARGLVSDPPVVLEPIEVRPGIRFIRFHPAAGREFRIRYVDCCPWHPVEWWARWRRGPGWRPDAARGGRGEASAGIG
jgi:hypothetical protein